MAELTVKHVQDVTDFKDAKTAKAALATLAWLEAGAPHKVKGAARPLIFDMGEVARKNSCGTACCIAGARGMHRRHLLTDINRHGDIFGGQ